MGKYKLELFTVVINGKIVYTMGTRKERLGKKMTVLATEVGRVDVSNLDFLMPIANFMTANGPHQRTNCPNRGSVSSQHMVQWTSGSDMQRTRTYGIPAVVGCCFPRGFPRGYSAYSNDHKLPGG